MEHTITGRVEDGRFFTKDEQTKRRRLTTMRAMEASIPSAHEVDLRPYQGQTITVSYQSESDEWLYGAEIIGPK